MDFNVPAKVGTDIEKVPGGFDHNWVLNKKDTGIQLAAILSDPGTGRYMEVYTTQPGIQFYTGNFLDGKVTGKFGMMYIKNAALCLETQHFPDSPNHPDFPSTIVKPGKGFHSQTIFKFSTE